MCRDITHGGRRCPCSRGDRRRAYQRLRYATSKSAAATTPTVAENDSDTTTEPSETPLVALRQRRTETARAAHDALTALREPDKANDPAVQDAYAAAVLDHGAVLRDITDHHIATELTREGLDDAAIDAEELEFDKRLQRAEAIYRVRVDYAPTNPDGSIVEEYAENLNDYRKELEDTRAGIYREAQARTEEITRRRADVIRSVYYRELAEERTFGTAEFTPTNLAKMTKADRAMFTATTALYPDEMVEHSAGLGEMLAKRSKARAHYSSANIQKARRTRHEVFELEGVLRYRPFSRMRCYFVDSPADMAAGRGSRTDRFAHPHTTVPRTPDNESRIAEMLAEYNAAAKKPAVMEFATHISDDGHTHEVIYVRGSRTRATMETVGITAEVTYSDPSSMTHEMAHRMEDRNPEIGVATKRFLHRRTEGLPKERYVGSEVVVSDGFSHRYMGKDYPNSQHTELFSCGMEAITNGRFGGLRGDRPIALLRPESLRPATPRADREHLALVLGLLATANKRAATV